MLVLHALSSEQRGRNHKLDRFDAVSIFLPPMTHADTRIMRVRTSIFRQQKEAVKGWLMVSKRLITCLRLCCRLVGSNKTLLIVQHSCFDDSSQSDALASMGPLDDY